MKAMNKHHVSYYLSSIRLLLVLAGAFLPLTQLRAELIPLGEDAEDSFALLTRFFDGNPGKPDYRRDAGFAIHIGCEDGSKTALLRSCLFAVHGLDASAANVDRARRKLQDRGLYGPIEIHRFDGSRLPYIDNLANLIVSDEQEVSPAEIDRVLAPDGIALIDGRAFRKKRPEEIDDWTHYLYDAAGSGASGDRKFEIPNRIQWHGGPLWAGDHDNDSTLNAMVAASGRVFSILGESKFQVPHKDIVIPYYLTAHDAHNGVILWKRKLDRWGWQQWKAHYAYFNITPLQLPRRLVAVEDRVYVTLGYHSPISVLDAATGEKLFELQGSKLADELVVHDNVVIAAINSLPPKPESTAPDTRPRAEDYPPKTIKAFSASDGRLIWSTGKIFGSVNKESNVEAGRRRKQVGKRTLQLGVRAGAALANIVAGSGAVCFADRRELVCLDFATGKERWRTEAVKPAEFPWRRDEVKAGSLKIANDVVFVNEPAKITAYALADGSPVWSKPHSDVQWFTWRDAFIRDDDVIVWGHERGTIEAPTKKGVKRYSFPKTVKSYDVSKGELSGQTNIGSFFAAAHHHRCYQNKMTANYIIAGRIGTEFVNLETGKTSVVKWVRGTCDYGIMPAYGMLYTAPNTCWCYSETLIQGYNALSATFPGQPKLYENVRPELVEGPAYGLAPDPDRKALPTDWPTFRADRQRTGANPSSRVSPSLTKVWAIQGSKGLTAPVIARNRIYLADKDRRRVFCLDLESGDELWSHTSGGTVDSPPTYSRGFVVFGSSDGTVSALQAGTGRLIWRFHTAKDAWFHGNDGRIASVLPVHGSVLVENGRVVFAAGQNAYLDSGVFFYALDLQTGEVLKSKHHFYHSEDVENLLEKDGVHKSKGMRSGIAASDGEFLYIQNSQLDHDLNQVAKGQPKAGEKFNTKIISHSTLLDDTITKRNFRFLNQGRFGTHLCLDTASNRVYSTCTVDTIRFLVKKQSFKPGESGGFLFRSHEKTGNRMKTGWEIRHPIVPFSMVATDKYLLVGGGEDEIDPKDSQKNYQGRGKGLLYVLSRKDGSLVKSYELEAPPIHEGIAIAGHAIVIALRSGKLVSFLGRDGDPNRG